MWPFRRRKAPAVPLSEAQLSTDLSVEFVLIAEAGILERQALFLCESLRQFAGRYARCPITVASPRASRRPSLETLQSFERLGCSYLPLDVDSIEPEYGTTFRMYVSAEVEKISKADVLIVMDSDMLFCREPDLALNGVAAALRPVDVKGMCTFGRDDPRDGYWQALCQTLSVDYDCVPMIETTVDKARVKASYNGGLVAVRRQDRILERTLGYFERSVAAKLAPNVSHRIEAGHGVVSGRGSELWGSSQACLSLALWGNSLTVRTLSEPHNYPLHLFDQMPVEQQRLPLSIVHYHDVFTKAPERNPLLNGTTDVPADFLTWLEGKAATLGNGNGSEGRRARI